MGRRGRNGGRGDGGRGGVWGEEGWGGGLPQSEMIIGSVISSQYTDGNI